MNDELEDNEEYTFDDEENSFDFDIDGDEPEELDFSHNYEW